MKGTIYAKPDKGYLFGMDCLLKQNVDKGIPYDKQIELLKNLGCQSMRHWCHFGYVMSDYKTFMPREVEKMHKYLEGPLKLGLRVYGMCHSNWSLTQNKFVTGKPEYNPTEGSLYNKWLDCYEESWYLLTKEFQELIYWEIDNELNNKDFMFILEKGCGTIMPTIDTARISADMLFRASRGIHRGNPKAITILGGIVDPIGLGISEPATGNNMKAYMEMLYDEIEYGRHGSTNPDDFFEVACWHPYIYTQLPNDYFWEENLKIYEIIKRREGKDKKVIFSELGWDPILSSMDFATQSLIKLYKEIPYKLPFVESVCWYRMFDRAVDTWNPRGIDAAGLFYDPNVSLVEKVIGQEERAIPGSPKPTAYAYQQLAGGEGSLDVLKGEILK